MIDLSIREKIKSDKWVHPSFNQTFLVTTRDELISLPHIVADLIRNYEYDLFDDYVVELREKYSSCTDIRLSPEYHRFNKIYQTDVTRFCTLINLNKNDYVKGWPETLFTPMMFKCSIYFPFHIIIEYSENVTQPWLQSFEDLIVLKHEFRGHNMKNFGL